jgi:signal transduction histidine kinase
MILSILSILAYLYRLRVSHLLERERLKARISAELHDEIGSGLTRIALLSEIAQKCTVLKPPSQVPVDDKGGKPTEEAISRIGLLARELHENMGDVVWSINPRNDSMESYVQRAVGFLNEICEARGITVAVAIDDGVKKLPASPEILHNLLLVTKEAMTNVVRHSGSSRIGLELRKKPGAIELVVIDNGRGFEKDKVAGNGLANMTKRVHELSGTISIISERGKGTTVRVSVPHRRS